MKNVTGLYLYATGAQRQAISIMSSFGISASYPSIAGNGRAVKLSDSLPDPEAKQETQLDESESENEDPDWEPSTSESSSEDDTCSNDGDLTDHEREETVEGDEPPVSTKKSEEKWRALTA